jgi:hypothetical protein
MDAAAAAAMSDPEHNPHFRRRWLEATPAAVLVTPRSTAGVVGPIGLALIDAWQRKQQAAAAASAVPGRTTSQ